jgi:hypothetical protein
LGTFLFCFIFVFVFEIRSPCSPGWPQTQVLPQPLECRDYRVHHHIWLMKLFKVSSETPE